MLDDDYASWGRIKSSYPESLLQLPSRFSSLGSQHKLPLLAYGNGRSYGDEAYNDGGILILNKQLDKFISFDRNEGILCAEGGVLLRDILNLVVPCGWFLAVTPGTQLVTLGGAIANDVHGKNHHRVGSFGLSVLEFELVRSDGSRRICSRQTESVYYYATLGGLGLTGWISWARIQLIEIQSSAMISCSRRFTNLREYFELNQILETQNAYGVAWIDCLARGKNLGRGVYFTGEHAGFSSKQAKPARAIHSIPFELPFSCINGLTLKVFNSLYYWQHKSDKTILQPFQQFFYPLDQLLKWNRLYGRKGFYQYQCVLPFAVAEPALSAILQQISRCRQGSFLAVLKSFGAIVSGGLLSFPRPGVTLALDFANHGVETLKLFSDLDQIVKDANGALYPAKDTRMSPEMFKLSFPKLDDFIRLKDPGFSSNFWRRVIPEN